MRNLSTIFTTSLNILVVLILGSFSIPAQAISLKNGSFTQQLKLNNNTRLNTPLIQIVPFGSKSFSKNPESQKNELESRLLAEAKDTINEVREANKVIQEDISGKTVYLYKLETIKPVALSNNANILPANQVTWKLQAPKRKRKVPEPSTGLALVLAFIAFAARYSLKRVQKF
ncbi:hypothetical protein DSM106972_055620 [Dulcicalothrix desertica PCC 7102]|uniref:Uncharacterized protein n=1 Tax=Dulcicalothrix desertica PCC 7102 TaxID=232991 RepID=A0A433VAX3_9CYAN|nr:hypothetical protein [Dulcicalothrix desertica]RUT03254.1 hypothetical protein DSM106972_055620 [Dulcicalothrix desertica PCC 7102]TWH53621.1 putative secreted protein with PEP-CTERM sorting signal [Dulcicalothrix desertica PCC 7102]